MSVFRISTNSVLATADYSNLTNDQIHNYGGANIADMWFGYTPKTAYMRGRGLNKANDTYNVYNFTNNGQVMQFPNCITQSDGTNYAEVKKFFCDKNIVEGLANDFGMAYDDMVSEDIKLIIEPVVYFKYDSLWYAMTATECALWEQTYGPMAATATTSGMTNLTELTLPLSAFLEKDDSDVGINAYTGGAYKQSASTIKNEMGVGIIYFKKDMDNPGGEHGPCCDCDEYCPCKYTDGGQKINGDCRCFDDHDDAGHSGKIPCDPDYPDNCFCQLGTLRITKTDEKTGAKLAGAAFTIQHTVTKQTMTGFTDSNGICEFKDIHIGYWRVAESAVPAGYIATFSPKTVTVLPNKVNTMTVTNMKDEKKDDPVTGDNIIWGYQLTKSFTNETNFSNTVNYPANAEPRTIYCSGYTYDTESAGGGWTRIGGPHPHEHKHYITETYQTGTDKNGNPTYGTRQKYSYSTYTYGYDYRHNDQHMVDYDWISGDVTVRKAAFIGSNVFTDNSVFGKYRIMHNGGNYLLKFQEHDSNYIMTSISGLFKELKHKIWISHRNGGIDKVNSSSNPVKEIPLAKYMASSNENTNYNSFYTKYTGRTARAMYTNDGSAIYTTINDITTSTKHGGTCDREYKGTYCNGGTKANLQHSADTNKATQEYKYSVEGSYRATANSTVGDSKYVINASKNEKESGGYISQIFQSPSNIFTFYPTYKMWYTNTLGRNDTNTAWMLSAGMRQFQATDAIKVEITGGQTDVWAPWSRDWVDKYTDDSTYGSEIDRGYSVVKAGMVIKAVAQDAKIKITAAFNIQDPSFVGDKNSSEYKAIEKMNNNKAKEMEAAVNAIKADLIDMSNISYGFYSNLWQATSQNIIAQYPDADTLIPAALSSWAKSEAPKTRLDIQNGIAPATKEARIIYGTSGGTGISFNSTMTLNGQTYYVTNRSSAMNAYTKTNESVLALLDTATGTSGKRNVTSAAYSASPEKRNWYEEYYDGIRVAVYEVTITIPSEQLSTDYVQVHSQISDSTTELNAYAHAYKNPSTGDTMIPEGMYGIGLCAVQKTTTTVSLKL